MNQAAAFLTKPAYSLTELLRLVPIGRTTIYREVKTGNLRATKRGRRTIFLASDIAGWLEQLPAASPAEPKPASTSRQR